MTIKIALSTLQAAEKSTKDLLHNLRALSISPNLPLPREILHKRTEEHPRRPSQPIDM